MSRETRWHKDFPARSQKWALLLLLSLLGSQADASSRQRHRQSRPAGSKGLTQDGLEIPKLLHHIYLPGFEAFTADATKPDTKVPKKYFEACQNMHQHWDSLFWNEDMGAQFLKEHYPWAFAVWESFHGWGKDAKKSDVLRTFIMHHYGGVYLDLDIECFKPVDDSLKGYQVVLQGTGDEGFNNAVMASIPGHPFWLAYGKEIEKRSQDYSSEQVSSPMWQSGTLALSQTLRSFIQNYPRAITGWNSLEYEAEGRLRVYSLGEWYMPCYGTDHICNRQFEKEHAEGIWDMKDLYGRHFFAELPQPLDPLLKDHYVA